MEEKWIRLDEINPKGLFILLLKNLWVIAALCISALLCYTSVCRLFYTPTYTSTATLMVSAKDSTSAYNSLTTTQSMASVFVEVFQSNVLREKIQEKMPDGHFDGTIRTRTIPETNLLIVEVTSAEPDTSFRALNLLVENYSSISDYLFSNAQLEVIKDPVIPVVPSNPLNVESKYMLVTVIAGGLAVCGIVAIYLLRDTVKTPKAAQRKIDARLLRTISHEKKNKTLRAKLRRKNSAPLITNSLIKKDFIEDNLSLCSKLEYHARKRGQKVIMVTSIGENEGKSTIAANLALSLAEKNRRVVLLEAKKHKVTLGVSQNSGRNVAKLLNNGRFSALLQDLRNQVDYVIVDTPPMLVAADAETIATMADAAILVVRADYMPAYAINEGLERLKNSAPEVCGIVLNDYRTTIL